MRLEVENVLLPVRIAMEWREYDPSRIGDSVCSLVCLRLGDPPRIGTGVQVKRSRGELGRTHITDGEILPFCDVDWIRVKEMLARFVSGKPAFLHGRLWGRALGRVVAHEFYHVIAHTRAHSKSGLAKERLTLSDLTAADVGFDECALELMRRATEGRVCEGRFSERRPTREPLAARRAESPRPVEP
jgi:hypothetical protein